MHSLPAICFLTHLQWTPVSWDLLSRKSIGDKKERTHPPLRHSYESRNYVVHFLGTVGFLTTLAYYEHHLNVTLLGLRLISLLSEKIWRKSRYLNLNAKSLDIIIILEILIRPIFFGITALSSLQDTTTDQEMILSVRNWPKSIQFYCSFSWQDPNLVLWVVFHEYAWFVCCAYKTRSKPRSLEVFRPAPGNDSKINSQP